MRRPGQALVEFAFILPMLVLMLAAIVYLCGLVVAQQSMAVAARSAARSMALDATAQGLRNAAGRGGVARPAVGTAAMQASLPGAAVRMAGVTWASLGPIRGGPYAASFLKTNSRISLGSGEYGQAAIGCALYGATVTRDLRSNLTPIGQLAATMSPREGLARRLLPSLSATSVMAAELPIRGTMSGAQGILDSNTWITKIVSRPPKPIRVR
jgi:hypothetical protein